LFDEIPEPSKLKYIINKHKQRIVKHYNNNKKVFTQALGYAAKVFVKSPEPTINLKHNHRHKKVVSGMQEHDSKQFDEIPRPNDHYNITTISRKI
jgi:hypothetical protein